MHLTFRFGYVYCVHIQIQEIKELMFRSINSGDQFTLPGKSEDFVITVRRITEDKKFEVITSNGKISVVSLETLSTFERYKPKKEKKKSLLDIAVEILIEKNEPMKVCDILVEIKRKGYEPPRGGGTLECSLSSRLTTNSKDLEALVRVKKISCGIFAHKDWNGNFSIPLTKFEQRELEKQRRKTLIESETNFLLE